MKSPVLHRIKNLKSQLINSRYSIIDYNLFTDISVYLFIQLFAL